MAFKKLFRRERSNDLPVVPSGYRVYAIGDIHGRADLLDEALAYVEADNRSREPAQTILIFLGDYVDRGPASAAVIERLRSYRPEGVRTVFLSGNHEEVLLRILDGDAQIVPDWLRFGGAECAESYGIEAARIRRMAPDEAVAALKMAVPSEHRRFLDDLADTFRVGDYLFVHAGVRPGIALEEQSQSDLRWIRSGFLDHTEDHGFIVVHGHTIATEIDVRPNRIGLDTGAYRSGLLTVMGLEGPDRWFFQTQGSSVSATRQSGPAVIDAPRSAASQYQGALQ